MRSTTAERDRRLTATHQNYPNGYLRSYTGTPPASTETAATGTLIATHRFATTPFGAPSSGSVSGSFQAATVTAVGAGAIGYCRSFASDGTTPLDDFVVGTDVIITGGAVVIGQPVTVTSCIISKITGTV